MEFKDLYLSSFDLLGHPLGALDACPEDRILAAEERLCIRAPRSLREYYLVAGGENRFNQIQNRFLDPEDWFIDGGHLVFLEENQVVTYWGVKALGSPESDPPVFQGTRADPVIWHPENEMCSIFLAVMVHWHGAFGHAMPHAACSPVPADVVTRLDRDWEFAGEVNEMRAYHRKGQVACFVEWRDIIFRMRNCSPWRIFAGATTAEGLESIVKDLEMNMILD